MGVWNDEDAEFPCWNKYGLAIVILNLIAMLCLTSVLTDMVVNDEHEFLQNRLSKQYFTEDTRWAAEALAEHEDVWNPVDGLKMEGKTAAEILTWAAVGSSVACSYGCVGSKNGKYGVLIFVGIILFVLFYTYWDNTKWYGGNGPFLREVQYVMYAVFGSMLLISLGFASTHYEVFKPYGPVRSGFRKVCSAVRRKCCGASELEKAGSEGTENKDTEKSEKSSSTDEPTQPQNGEAKTHYSTKTQVKEDHHDAHQPCKGSLAEPRSTEKQNKRDHLDAYQPDKDELANGHGPSSKPISRLGDCIAQLEDELHVRDHLEDEHLQQDLMDKLTRAAPSPNIPLVFSGGDDWEANVSESSDTFTTKKSTDKATDL